MCSNANTRFLMRLVVDILLLTSVYCVALLIVPHFVRSHQRGFFCGDESLLYPYKPVTVLKRLHMIIFVVALPAALVLCVEMLRVAFPAPKTNFTSKCLVPKSPQRYRFVGINIPTFVSEYYNTMGIYLFGLALVVIINRLCQAVSGRLTPYFFEVCEPLLSPNETACSSQEHFGIYIENYSCGSLTSSQRLLNNMRRSFPSCYASSAAYAMLYMAVYLQARLQTGWLLLWRTVLQISTVSISLLVSLERVMAFRHHWSDVLAGMVIGYAMALFMTNLVSQLFKKVTIKVRRVREESSNIYGYYTVMPRPRYC